MHVTTRTSPIEGTNKVAELLDYLHEWSTNAQYASHLSRRFTVNILIGSQSVKRT